jgi:hypothetical protein
MELLTRARHDFHLLAVDDSERHLDGCDSGEPEKENNKKNILKRGGVTEMGS